MIEPRDLPDDLLLKAFADSNDRIYYEELIGRYKQKLFNFICRYTSDKDSAEDILQEVFIKVYFNAKKLKNFDHASSWIFKIAVNTSINYFRKSKLMPISLFAGKAADEDFVIDVVDSAPVPDVQLLSREQEGVVQRAISKLPERYRAVIILQYISGLQLSEIASILGKPVGTIKSLSSRGRDMLKKELKDYVND